MKDLNTLNIYKPCMEKIYLVLILTFLIVPLTLAEVQTLGGNDGFIKGQTISLEQTNPDCSYMTLDSVRTQSQKYLINENMTLIGSTFYYNFTNTNELGEYTYKTCCNDGNGTICVPVNFYVNQTGTQDEALFYYLFIALAVLLGTVFFILSFMYDKFLAIFSAIGFFAGGIMTLYFPFGAEQQFITQVLSIVLNGIGLVILGIYVIKEWLPEDTWR